MRATKMPALSVVPRALLLLLALHASAAGSAGFGRSQCRVAGAANCVSSETLLLQTRRSGKRLQVSSPVFSGTSIFLKAWLSGHRITTQTDGSVHAQWANQGDWERFVMEKVGGEDGDLIVDGDKVFIRSWIGRRLTFDDDNSVHAHWDHKGEWEKFTIEKADGGALIGGDIVFLRTWKGTRVDADAPDSHGIVQARWNHTGDWQKLVVELAELTTTTVNPLSTTSPTTLHPSGCIPSKSLGKCEPCLKSDQCGEGRYCCPYMKKCVISASEVCYAPIADCSPLCPDKADNAVCQCSNANFPQNWQLPTCPATSASPTSSTSPTVTTTLAGATTTAAEGPRSMPTVVPPEVWEHFELLNALRGTGFTCPGGKVFPANNKPLRFDCRLWRAAQLHSQDMADNDYFEHFSLDGTTPWDRAQAQGTIADSENIAAGLASADGTLEQWKTSDTHCRNMMSPRAVVVGVGHGANVQSDYRDYWTQLFTFSDTMIDDRDTGCYPSPSLMQEMRSRTVDSGHSSVGEPWFAVP